MVVEEKIKQIKKSLQDSADVSFRVLRGKERDVGFVYLRSITAKNCFEKAIYGPIEKAE